AVLRPARSARRDFRIDGEPAQRTRRRVSAGAQAAVLRAADQAGRRRAEDHLHSEPAVDSHAAAERPTRMPLLWPVRTRLRDAFQLLVAVGVAAAGAR